MAYTQQDAYETGDGAADTLSAGNWTAQTFTTGSAYTISRVALKMYRQSGDPGTITVSIRATSSGLPVTPDLCVGTIAGSSLTTVSPGEWYTIDMTVPVALDTGTVYSIVARAPSASSGSYVYVRVDGAPTGYSTGQRCTSSNSGSSWTGSTADQVFKTYSGSDVVYVDAEASIVGIGSLTATAVVAEFIDAAATITGAGSVTASAIVNLINSGNRIVLVALGHDELWFEDS